MHVCNILILAPFSHSQRVRYPQGLLLAFLSDYAYLTSKVMQCVQN